jgi:hypothetical protein
MPGMFIGDWADASSGDHTAPPRQLEIVSMRSSAHQKTVGSWRLVAALVLRASGMPICDIIDVLRQYVAPLVYYWGGPSMYLDFKFGNNCIEGWQCKWLAEVLVPYVANGFILLLADEFIPLIVDGNGEVVNAPRWHGPDVFVPTIILDSAGYTTDYEFYEHTCKRL